LYFPIPGGKVDLPHGLPKDYYKGFKGCLGHVFILVKELHLYNDRYQINSAVDFCHWHKMFGWWLRVWTCI